MKYTAEYWKDVTQILDGISDKEKLFHKTIFITGATGMLCSAVVDAIFQLNRECSAGIQMQLAGRSRERMAARFPEMTEGEDYTFFFYDAEKSGELSVSADYIIHGASNADPAMISAHPVETMRANLFGLDSLLRAAQKQESCRLLYISTSEIYGKKAGNQPYGEEDYGFVDILNPRASYPSGKRAAETLCASYGAEYGVDTVIVRPGHIYGPTITERDSRASAEFTRLVARGKDIVMKGAGQQLRSYCYVLDSASAILTILLRGKTGEAYNISNPNSIASIREMAECLGRLGNVQVKTAEASVEEKRSYNLMENSSLASEKLEALGWKGIFSLEQGIAATLREYEDKGEH